MSTFMVSVDNKQKKVLKSLLEYLKFPFEEVNPKVDFWPRLTEAQQRDIDDGLADADANRVRPLQDVLKKYQ